MVESAAVPACTARYELRFTRLLGGAYGLAFPCDAEGHVDIDHLSDSSRNNYLYARTVVGREFAAPQIVLVTP